MNWDWEKLRQNQQKFENKREGGGPNMPIPPQMDELLKKFKDFKLPGIFLVVIVLLVLFFGSSTFFTIKTEEVGVIQRFGKYKRIVQPGLNFKLPSGIEKVTKVKVKRIYKEEFGLQSDSVTSNYRAASESSSQGSSLMLTGDLNVAVVPWIVQYKISNPSDYLFKVKDVRAILRDMSEATMRTVVGDRSINEVISKREEIALAAKDMLQKEMDSAESGIKIVNLEMKKTNVPGPVQSSFNEVNQAIQEKEQTIYKAREEYNKAVPLARGEAKRVIKDAEGYAIDRINRAQGDATKFLAVYKAYALAKMSQKSGCIWNQCWKFFPTWDPSILLILNRKIYYPF